jgi:uncharacterized membrane protein YqjE
MALALLTVTVAQLLDLGTFVGMVVIHGPSVEANPIVAHLLMGLGLPFVAVAKIAALSLIVSVIVVIAQHPSQRHRRIAATVVAAAVIAGVVGGWTNAEVLRGGF